MNKERLRGILKGLADQQMSVDEAMDLLKTLPYQDLGFAKLDNHRALRDNFPEVIYCPGKTPQEVALLIAGLHKGGHNVIATRAAAETYTAVSQLVTEAQYDERSRLITVVNNPVSVQGGVAVITAGTADIPVAEEARVVAEEMGCQVLCEYDVGVAGIHRLFPCLERMADADAFVVAAGREGTLPAVVAGLVDAPVIGLPVSTGYGLGGGGRAALYSMLQSCSVLTVVNVDAGFVAGAYAAKIARQKAHKGKQS